MIFFEDHSKDNDNNCQCSYCSGMVHYGLNIPSNWKDHTSWYTIKYGRGLYLRWTGDEIHIRFKKVKIFMNKTIKFLMRSLG